MTPHKDTIRLLDVVALIADLPERRLLRGQVGTVVETLARGVFEVEFSDDQGRTYAQSALLADQLLVLHYQPLQAAGPLQAHTWPIPDLGLGPKASGSRRVAVL